MHLLHLVALLLGFAVGLGTPLIAYDCTNSETNITVISIKNIAPCPTVKSDYREDNSSVWVLQRNDFGQQKVWTCLVEVTRHIQHCGTHSHGSPVAAGLSSFVYTLGNEKCRNLHKDKMITIYNQIIGDIKMNGTTEASLTILGKITNDAKCKGSTYTENGHSWEDVVIQAAIKIITRDYMATVKFEDDEISLISGVTCPFLKGYCIDSTFGESIWEPVKDTACDKDLSLLYKGKATIISQSNRKIEKILVVEQADKIFALSLVKTTSICGYQVWQTEHPKIMVLESDGEEYINPRMTLLPQNTDLLSYINSKLLYTEQAYKRAVETLYFDTIHRRCMAYREILKNRLMLAPLTPNAVSSIIKNKMGYDGRVLGEALYILQCVPRSVTIRRTKYCYNELPISVNNQSKFMAPVTHLILEQATQVMCETLTPPLYQVDGNWIGLTPDPVMKNSPIQLQSEASNKSMAGLPMWEYSFFIKTIKYLLGVILNGLAIYKTFGCGLALLASLWNTLTLFIMHHKKDSRSRKENEAELERLDKSAKPSAPSESIINIHESSVSTSNIGAGEKDVSANGQHTTPTEYSRCSQFLSKISN